MEESGGAERSELLDGEGELTPDRKRDAPHALRAWAKQEGYDFPLLADFWPHGAVARSYGTFNEVAGMANRGTFLVDRSGVVRFAEVNGPGQRRDQGAWRRAIDELGAAV